MFQVPDYEVQSAHFSEKQYTLHCAIAEPFDTRYHYHLSDDTKHDPFYVDQVLRDIIIKYNIKNEDLWIQSIMHGPSIKISMRLLYYKS